MFEGSEHVGEKAHIKYVQSAGGTDINGTTDFDRTNYFETVPSNQLELALWLESDRMGFLMEGLNRTLLTNQRDSCSVSMTTPWPAKAASPCTSTGSTRAPCTSSRRSWRPRTEPSTTGSTTSRCEGLNASTVCTLPAGVRRSAEKPL